MLTNFIQGEVDRSLCADTADLARLLRPHKAKLPTRMDEDILNRELYIKDVRISDPSPLLASGDGLQY